MVAFLEKLAEEKILKALNEGGFQNLPGEGKPLAKEDIFIPEDLRIAYRMLKTADFLPPELALRKEINHLEELAIGMEDSLEKLKTMRKLNAMIRKLNILQSTRPDCEVREYYLPKLVERLEAASPCLKSDSSHEKEL